MRPTLCVIVALGALGTTSASAHRLDELLQQVQISIAPARVTLDLYLDPGIDVAPAVLAKSDTDHDGQFSSAEIDAYARKALSATTLVVDGMSLRPVLLAAESSTSQELLEGLGSMHLRAAVDAPPLSNGRHSVTFT